MFQIFQFFLSLIYIKLIFFHIFLNSIIHYFSANFLWIEGLLLQFCFWNGNSLFSPLFLSHSYFNMLFLKSENYLVVEDCKVEDKEVSDVSSRILLVEVIKACHKEKHLQNQNSNHCLRQVYVPERHHWSASVCFTYHNK